MTVGTHFPSSPAGMADRPLWRRILSPPATRLGWWSFGLTTGFFLLFAAFMGLVLAGQKGGATFFSNPWLALPSLAAAVSAVAGGVAAVMAVFWKGERSLLLLPPLVVGCLVLAFVLGELGGH